MSPLSSELVAQLAGYVVDRRDKRRITAGVLGLYAAALVYHFVAPALGAPAQPAALASIETLALVVVVAHIAGGAAQRAVAQRALAPPARAPRPGRSAAEPAEPAR